MVEEVFVPRDALVIRFRPTDPERVLGWAVKTYRRTGYYRLSVFADAAQSGEDPHSLRSRLLAAAEADGIDPNRNKRYYVCAAASLLYDNGFHFFKDGLSNEPAEHYSVDLGNEPSLRDVERFLEAFTSAEEWPT